ncbi:hypothetical protein ACHHYP_09380 [Achlya hypogyna]|uniref:Uncharacterized protein n=1 Tax=Achlya hypogyna TaxID=1202772 RepID=A0A1V9ZJ57_ACHHY|nr:hypothetical protein ACHHYP_09380 [Achlya hypogyna]
MKTPRLSCIKQVPRSYAVVGAMLYLVAATGVFFWHRHHNAAPTHAISALIPEARHVNCTYDTPEFVRLYEEHYRNVQQAPTRLGHPSIENRAGTWDDCLPMHTVVCGVAAGAADTLFEEGPLCRAAVLHHLLAATTAAVERRGQMLMPIGATLQHIWEYAALPPRASHLEVLTDAPTELAAWLWARGLAHFHDGPTAVTCIARHHVLADLLGAKDAADTTPPHLRWSTLEPAGDRFVVAPQREHAYRSAQLFPPVCVPLYTTSIPSPAHAATFFTAALGMLAHESLDATYPSADCEARCDQDTPRPVREATPNVAKCPVPADAVYDARLQQFEAQRIPLTLDAVHAEALAPFSDTAKLRRGEAWEYCLPMRPQQCGARRGTKATLFETPKSRPCRSAVLHLLLEAMLEVVYELNLPSFVYFGTLLGAWRDEAIIPHTRDIDIVMPSDTDWAAVQDAMWARGFYVFKRDIHGACVASHHPLAPLMYHTGLELVTNGTWAHGTPYLDLYMWNQRYGNDVVAIETAQDRLDTHMVFPLTCHEKIFSMHVPGIQHPEAMFRSEYGTTYAQDPDLHLESCESYCDFQLLGNSTEV